MKKPARCGFLSFLTSAADFEDRFLRVSKITVFFLGGALFANPSRFTETFFFERRLRFDELHL